MQRVPIVAKCGSGGIMQNCMEGSMKKGLIMIVVGVLGGIAQALVLMMMWRWYITPLGVPEINIFHSAGIILTKIAIAPGGTQSITNDEWLSQMLKGIIALSIVFALGAILQVFV